MSTSHPSPYPLPCPALRPSARPPLAGAAERFDRRMGRVLTDWCCRSNEDAEKYNKPPSEQLRFNLVYSRQEGLDSSC